MTAPLVSAAVLLWIVAAGAALAVAFRREIVRAWREPVLSAPVLIVESDDWGYGPLEQAELLRRIAELLARHRDHTGQPAVMTLGVILGGPDTERIAQAGGLRYERITLADAPLQTIRAAMTAGAQKRVFGLQLHAMEHFHPEVLLKAAERNPLVRSWLTGEALPQTEALPARLQSRWIDAAALPSKPLAPGAVEAAAFEEVKAFESIFGVLPEVAVPPTFIWTPAVERAWAAAGVRVVVTPGRRYVGRDTADRPVPEAIRFHNAEHSPCGPVYLVRDDFFEPALGHRVERGMAAVATKTELGRPTLLETHRANFLGDGTKALPALTELDRLLSEALKRWPALRFMSSAQLARHYAEHSDLIETRLLPRLHVSILRLAHIPRLRKLSLASGVALPFSLLLYATRRTRMAHMAF